MPPPNVSGTGLTQRFRTMPIKSERTTEPKKHKRLKLTRLRKREQPKKLRPKPKQMHTRECVRLMLNSIARRWRLILRNVGGIRSHLCRRLRSKAMRTPHRTQLPVSCLLKRCLVPVAVIVVGRPNGSSTAMPSPVRLRC